MQQVRSSVGQELGSHAKAKAGRWGGGGPCKPPLSGGGAGAGAGAGAEEEKGASMDLRAPEPKALPPLSTHISHCEGCLQTACPKCTAREAGPWELSGGSGRAGCLFRRNLKAVEAVPSDFQLLPPAFSAQLQAACPTPSPPPPPPLLYPLLAVPSAPPSSVYGTIAISVPGASDLGCVYPSHLSP